MIDRAKFVAWAMQCSQQENADAPALVKSSVGSLDGSRLDAGSRTWPCSRSKYERKRSRTSAAGRGLSSIAAHSKLNECASRCERIGESWGSWVVSKNRQRDEFMKPNLMICANPRRRRDALIGARERRSMANARQESIG